MVGSSKQKKGNLLCLDLSESSCFIAQIEESWLWHKRLCHVNFENLVKISKNRRVRGIPSLKNLIWVYARIDKLVRWERLVSKAKNIS